MQASLHYLHVESPITHINRLDGIEISGILTVLNMASSNCPVSYDIGKNCKNIALFCPVRIESPYENSPGFNPCDMNYIYIYGRTAQNLKMALLLPYLYWQNSPVRASEKANEEQHTKYSKILYRSSK